MHAEAPCVDDGSAKYRCVLRQYLSFNALVWVSRNAGNSSSEVKADTFCPMQIR